MRKLLLSLVSTVVMTSLVVAAEYTIVSYDKGKKVLVLKDKDGKQVEGQLTDQTKVTRIKKDGTKAEGDVTRVEKMLGVGDVAGKKLDATIEKGQVKEITTRGGAKTS